MPHSLFRGASLPTCCNPQHATALQHPEPTHPPLRILCLGVPSLPSLLSLGRQVYGEVKARMASLKVDLQQRDKTIQASREENSETMQAWQSNAGC